MIWAAVLTLAAASYGLKALGPALIGRRQASALVVETLDLLPIPMLAAIVLVGTADGGGHLQLDARLAGLAVALPLILRRAPFLVVIVASAATTALIRAL